MLDTIRQARYVPLRWLFLATSVLVLAPAGCSEDQSIRTYKVAKQDTKPRLPAMRADAEGRQQQLLAAIVPNGKSTWFFKLTGEPEKVSRNRDEFRSIVDSVTFSGTGGPSWKLSNGWTQQRSQGITYAKLLKQDEGLTATVTELSNPNASDEDGWQAWVVQNVNRWRRQLTLEHQSWEAIEPELEEVTELSQGPAKAYFVSLLGRQSGASMGGPFSGGGMAPMAPPKSAPTQQPEPQREATLTYDLPDGWSELDVSSSRMRLAAFQVSGGEGSDGEQAEVTVIAASGAIRDNLGMWFAQVAIENTEEALQSVIAEAQQVGVHGVSATVYWLDGSQAPDPQAIWVAEIPWRDGESLFVKLKGNASFVKTQRDHYFEFLQSIKW